MNNLSGPVENWIGLTSLSRLIVQPGNPGLCTYGTTQLPFSLCTSSDVSCLVQVPQLEGCPSNQTSTVPGPSSENSTGTGAGANSSTSTSSGVSAVAIAVPIAVGVPLVAGVACFLFLFLRRRRREKTSDGDERDKRNDPREGHPFDTFEGQETLTSPFAGMILRGGVSGQIAPTGTAASPSATQNTSSESRDSIASMCARIRTRSFDLPRGDTTGEIQLGTSPPGPADPRLQAVSSPANLESGQFFGAVGAIGGQSQSGGKSQTSLQGSSESLVGPERSFSHVLPIPFSDWEITPQGEFLFLNG